MKTRFWTALQEPLCQAVLVENGKIIKRIPPGSPKTIVRKVGNVGEYKSTLVLLKHASFEQWDREGKKYLTGFHSKYIYGPHRIVQYEDDLLICASGLDLFFIMDLRGNIKWKWFAYKYSAGGRPDFFFKKDWITKQVTSNLSQISPDVKAHFNSIWMNNGKFLTSALGKHRIIEITINKPGFKHITFTEGEVHSPIYDNETLIYGTNPGLVVGGQKILTQFKWVKFVQKIETGFVFTHEEGVAFVDEDWKIMEKISLPRPFQIAFLEISR